MSNTPANCHQPVSAEAGSPCGGAHSDDSAVLADYYRAKLSEGGMSPSRERLMRNDLQRLERAA